MPRHLIQFAVADVALNNDLSVTNPKEALVAWLQYPRPLYVTHIGLTGSAAEGDFELKIAINGVEVWRGKGVATGRPITASSHLFPAQFAKRPTDKVSIIVTDAAGTNDVFMDIHSAEG